MRLGSNNCEMRKRAIDFVFGSRSRSRGMSAMLIRSGMRVLIVTSISFASCAVFAEPPKNITQQEKALLPEYCHSTQGATLGGNESTWNPSPRARHWINVLGGGQGHGAHLWVIHHYCYALIHMRRGMRAGLSRGEYLYEWAGVIEEIDFTLRLVPSDFILMPEMMLYRGRAMMRLKKPDNAIENFRRAIEAKADYWPPYLDIADYYASTGAKAKAISILQEGLANAPDAKPLKLRLTELGGVIPAQQVKKETPPVANPSSGPP